LVIDVPGGSHVDLTMSLSPVVVVFLLIWFAMMGGFASVALRQIIPSPAASGHTDLRATDPAADRFCASLSFNRVQ
jgi:hypothetical protein